MDGSPHGLLMWWDLTLRSERFWSSQEEVPLVLVIWTAPLQKAFSLPLLRCTTSEEGNKILKEIHKGKCRAGIKGWSLAIKALWERYYWPTLQADAIDMVRKCNKCQRFTPTQPTFYIVDYNALPVTFCKVGHGHIGSFPNDNRTM